MYCHRNFASKETRIFKLDCVKKTERNSKQQITELSLDKRDLKICGSKETALGKPTNYLADRKFGQNSRGQYILDLQTLKFGISQAVSPGLDCRYQQISFLQISSDQLGVFESCIISGHISIQVFYLFFFKEATPIGVLFSLPVVVSHIGLLI